MASFKIFLSDGSNFNYSWDFKIVYQSGNSGGLICSREETRDEDTTPTALNFEIKRDYGVSLGSAGFVPYHAITRILKIS